MKTVKLYIVMALVLITGILNAQNEYIAGIFGNQKDSFCLGKDCPKFSCKLSDICPAYTYNNNKRWAKSTYSIKISLYSINKLHYPQRIDSFVTNKNSDAPKTCILNYFEFISKKINRIADSRL